MRHACHAFGEAAMAFIFQLLGTHCLHTLSRPLLTLNITFVTLTANLKLQAAYKLDLW